MMSMVKNKKRIRYVFLSHGFQASHYDMLKVKHYFSNYRQDLRFVCIRANEEKTTEDIYDLGLNFAEDVKRVLEMDYIAGNIDSISFIGHSMGTLGLTKAV